MTRFRRYLSLPLSKMRKGGGIDLDSCIREFLKEEELTKNEQWHCPKCKEHVDAVKKFDLWKMPPVC